MAAMRGLSRRPELLVDKHDLSGSVARDLSVGYMERYEDRSIEGLIDKRLGRISRRRPPVVEVPALTDGLPPKKLGMEREAFLCLLPQSGGKRSYIIALGVARRTGNRVRSGQPLLPSLASSRTAPTITTAAVSIGGR